MKTGNRNMSTWKNCVRHCTKQRRHTKDNIKQMKWSDGGHLYNDADTAKLFLFGMAMAKVNSS
jgi:hypothetical protein